MVSPFMDLDFTANGFTDFKATSNQVHGIDSGYQAGNRVITANILAGGSVNSGETGVSGTWFIRNRGTF